ncbi:pentapeptide repeat-containing protein [Streptomyces sp. NPDC048277]|uniref:pentapeptide repeat-containing protein n=1 Tax=Streptomyces sp. NPDC048277 TaxID=3155027 RepID=UPI00340F26CA
MGVALLLGPVARRATRPYVTATTPPVEALESLTKIRSTVLQAVQGIVVVGGVLVTAGTLLYTAHSVRLAEENLDTTRDGQVTDRYNSAIENIGSKSEDVRIGGMYALQRIAEDSPHDRPTVVRVLGAFVRDHGATGRPAVPDDEATAVDVLLSESSPDLPADLHSAELPHLHKPDANLKNADLNGADLHGANLRDADLRGADLRGADLEDADLTGALLKGAELKGTTMPDGTKHP